MQRRVFIRSIGGASIAVATAASLSACSSAYPAQALEAWNGPNSAETEPRRKALAYAITAPNPHNLQPWLVDLREANVITLYTDPERVLPETDPYGRQILIGHGALLELLVIALAEFGFRSEVSLWPQGELPQTLQTWKQTPVPIARISLAQGGSKDELFAYILKRHTDKSIYDKERTVSPEQLKSLLSFDEKNPQKSTVNMGGTVDVMKINALRTLCLESAKIEINTPRTILESMRLMRIGPDEILRHRDGISQNSLMVRALNAAGMFDRTQAPKQNSAGHKGAIKRFEEHSMSAMGFVWLGSVNTRAKQIQVGRTYVRLHLQATAMNIALHPMSQALQEFAEMRPHYEQIHQQLLGKIPQTNSEDETLQMFCRIGFSKESSPTPRRALDQFIKT